MGLPMARFAASSPPFPADGEEEEAILFGARGSDGPSEASPRPVAGDIGGPPRSIRVGETRRAAAAPSRGDIAPSAVVGLAVVVKSRANPGVSVNETFGEATSGEVIAARIEYDWLI